MGGELNMVCTTTAAGGSGGSGSVNINNRTLIRTGGVFAVNSEISINSPGPGWATTGDTVTFSGSTDFVTGNQFFRNGQLLLPGESAGADNDVYYVSNTSFAFEFPILTNDIIQIWQFTTASG